MLRNMQIKIVLVFLVLGVIIIAAMGYTNYNDLKVIVQNTEQTNEART